jgi:excisionase family DNA binding protein
MEPVSVEEAARILGVGPRRVRALIEEQRLRATRIGRRAYVVDRIDAETLAQLPRLPGRPRKSLG